MSDLTSRPAEVRLGRLRAAVAAVVAFTAPAVAVALGAPLARATVRLQPCIPIPSDTPPMVASSTVLLASSGLAASGA